MLKVAKWGCSLLSCLCCGLLGVAGATVGEAAQRFHVVARILYLLFFFLTTSVAWVLYNLPSWLDSAHYLAYMPAFVGCAVNTTTSSSSGSDTLSTTNIVAWLLKHEFGAAAMTLPERLCYGALSSHRIMFALSLLHALLALAMIGADRRPGSLRSVVQHGWWTVKLAVVALFIAFLFFAVGNGVIVIYSWVAIVGSCLFVLVQILLFVEFAQQTNVRIAATYHQAAATGRPGRCLMGVGAILVVLLCYAGTIGFLAMAYASVSAECSGVIVGITGTLGLVLLTTAASVAAFRSSRGGILPVAIISVYSAYLTWSALSPVALHDAGCVPALTVQTNEQTNAVVVYLTSLAGFHDVSHDAQNAILFGSALLALGYAAFRTSSAISDLPDSARDEEEGRGGSEDGGRGGGDAELIRLDVDHSDAPNAASSPHVQHMDDDAGGMASAPAPYSFSAFHGIFMLASMYATSVITNWSALHFYDAALAEPGSGGGAVSVIVNHTATMLWIKLASAYALLILFTWTVFVPLCCRARRVKQ